VRRVALVLEELRPGGAERLVVHLAAALAGRGVETRVVCVGRPGALAPMLEAAGVPVEAVGSTKGYDLRAAWRLRRMFRAFRPDVVHVHDRSSLPYVVLATGLGRARPVVYTGHGLMFGETERPKHRHRLAARCLAAVTSVADEVAACQAAYLAWDGPVAVVPNAVPAIEPPPGAREGVRRELGADAGTFVFLAVGNARPEKAFERLCEAAARLRERAAAPAQDFAVWIAGRVGETPYCRDLLGRHAALGLEGTVRFIGFRDDAPSLYAAADAFVLSSRSEGLPMVVLEAMTAGLPIVATRVGGVPSTVGAGGVLCDADDPDALAEAMGRLLEDAGLRARLAETAARRARDQFSLDRMVARYLEVYARVAGGRRADETGTDA
jgi:glycosyltransferase involved in cell wall biosynthesis